MTGLDVASFKAWCDQQGLSKTYASAIKGARLQGMMLHYLETLPTPSMNLEDAITEEGFRHIRQSQHDAVGRRLYSNTVAKYMEFRGMPRPVKRLRLVNQQQQAPPEEPHVQQQPGQAEHAGVEQSTTTGKSKVGDVPDDILMTTPPAVVLSESQDIVPWFPRFYDSDYAKERKSRGAPGYSTKDMHKSTKMAWKSERNHFGTVRKAARERAERVRKIKAAEAALPKVDKVIEVKTAPLPRHTRYPQLTKKYLQLKSDRPELASQAFRMLSQSIGLCQQADDFTADPSTNALLLYKKGAWELTKLGTTCELHANAELICLDHPSTASMCFGPLFALTECTNIFTVSRFASIQLDGINRFERRPNSSPFFDNITKKTPYKQAVGMGNVMRMFEKPECDTMPVYAFPFVQARDPDWKNDTKFAFDKIAIDREADLKGWILMLHFGMLYTFFLNSIAHNSELIHQLMFHQILRQLLIAVHPDQWTVQMAECPALKSFLAHFHNRLTAWHFCFKTSCPQKKT